MNNQVIQIAARIRELREILDVPQEALAQKIGVDIEEYKRYESAQDDIPIGVLYGVAAELRVCLLYTSYIVPEKNRKLLLLLSKYII